MGEYFGSAGQQALQRRSENLWALVKDDPRFATHGRAVGLADYSEDNLPLQLAIARLQGVCPMEGLTQSQTETRKAELAAEGMKTDAFTAWHGEAESFAAARALLERRALPDDLTVRETGPDTPPEDLQALDAFTQTCEVLLPMGSFLRGRQSPSVFLYAQDREGRIVGASASVRQFHPDHPKTERAWWGMLATDPARRGQGIAILLGAMAMTAMQDKFGYTACFTGIRKGNSASEALCSKLKLVETREIILLALDPAMFGGDKVTK